MKPSEIRQAIIDYLSNKCDEGVLGSELVRELKVNRHTLAKHLEILNGQDILIFRQVGMAKLWVLNRRPFLGLDTDKHDSVMSTMFSEVINKTSNLVFVVDEKYNLIYMNRASKSVFGNNIGKKCYSSLLKRKLPCSKFCVVKEFLEKEKEGRREHITPIGDKIYRVTGFTIKNPDNSLSAVEIATDITREKELEEELKKIKKIIGNNG
jgi:transcriptional regulator with PAS, ATPase and Fis domain